MAHRKRSLTPPKNPFVARSRSSAGAEKNRFPRVDPETVSLADHHALRKKVKDLQAVVRQLWAQGHPNVGPSTLQQSTGLEALSTQHLLVTQFNFESPSQPPLNTPGFQSGPSLSTLSFQPPPYQPSSYTPSAQVTLPTTHAQNQPPRRPRHKRNFTPIATPWAVVFYRLVVSGLIKPIPARPPPKILPPIYKPDAKCTFHSGQPGHDIESCWTLRYKVQDLIDAKVIEVEEINRPATLKINQFSNHRGVNMVLGEENSDVFPPQQLIGPPGTIVVCSQLKKAPVDDVIGLQRCGKSCRLRWTNYLRPDIKRGKFSLQEEQTIIQLYALLGNRWSVIAAHLPKRMDNEIKNHWNTHLKKRLIKMGIDPMTHKPKSHALGPDQLKDAANLSHMAQWEGARLEAEARLVRESKLQVLKPFQTQPSSSASAHEATTTTPLPDLPLQPLCEAMGLANNFPDEIEILQLQGLAYSTDGDSFAMGNETLLIPNIMEARLGDVLLDNSNQLYTSITNGNSGSFAGSCCDNFEPNNYWYNILNLVNCSPSDFPVF
ncbi:hypothetical protein Vadar_010155 [Vaccinium darrowii]|uniref:Uncharacterized protein n=1 Tax=Vaccinium darrowii TaxID=229202 RepID=A0ACB7WZK5_9ERIC|nr:hypothetical protein Vadar_010155 [Vaccinium darrowii]